MRSPRFHSRVVVAVMAMAVAATAALAGCRSTRSDDDDSDAPSQTQSTEVKSDNPLLAFLAAADTPTSKTTSTPAIRQVVDKPTQAAATTREQPIAPATPAPAVGMPVIEEVQWIDTRQPDARGEPSSYRPSDRVVSTARANSERVHAAATDMGTRSDQDIVTTPGEPVVAIDEPAVSDANDAGSGISSLNFSREHLVALLAAEVRHSDDPSTAKALQLAALRALDPTMDLGRRDLEPLSDADRMFVDRVCNLLDDASEHAATGSGAFEITTAAMAADEPEEERPLTVRTAKLCRKVVGYGVYDEFQRATFLAGRPQRVIVYVELDDFAAEPLANGNRQVKLSQKVQLHNDADGLVVWSRPDQEIVDESRNVRRDFFVAQLIELPSRLTVGKYQLKVRVTDQHSQTTGVATVPIEIVADTALASIR